MERKFEHLPLELFNPDFESELTDLIIELNYLRKRDFVGSTPNHVFDQLKSVFQMLESIGSSRIEGNNTTVIEYVDAKVHNETDKNEQLMEIQNMEEALLFIDENVHEYPIDRLFISELHKFVVKGLTNEGSSNPGNYRISNVKIHGSDFKPPDYTNVDMYMSELIKFINDDYSPKYDLIRTAQAHHRFVWIHPFDNGNGRTVRLLTYAMLAKQGFNLEENRIVNPVAIFCNNRDAYYNNLSCADSGSKEGIETWCSYVVSGLKTEIDKIDRLLDYSYVLEKILIPTLKYSRDRNILNDLELKILITGSKKKEFKSADLSNIFESKKQPSEISRIIKSLRSKGFVKTAKNKQRMYIVDFSCKLFLIGIIRQLYANNFILLDNDKL